MNRPADSNWTSALARKARAWLAITRVANLPTVLSNVLVGTACGYAASVFYGAAQPLPGRFELLVQLLSWNAGIFAGAVFFYLAGMTLNDVADRRFDQKANADRPLVRGELSVTSARLGVVVFILAGLGCVVPYGPRAMTVALLLVGAIAAYNLTHKYFAGGVVFMGLCRALLYPLGAATFVNRIDPNLIWWLSIPFGCLVGLYVIGVTFVARAEALAHPGRRRWLSLALIPLCWLGVLIVHPSGLHWLWTSLAAAALTAWLGWCSYHVLSAKPNTKAAVLRWLAGLCLIDAFFLTLMNLALLAIVPALLFVGTRLLQRRLVGT